MIDHLRRNRMLKAGSAVVGLCLVLGPAVALSGKREAADSAKIERRAPAEPAREKIQTVPRADAKPSSTAWTAAEPQNRACFKSRRKFWQDGEGWIVKTVTRCP